MTNEPTGTDAHPAYNRALQYDDLQAAPQDFHVIDAYGVIWTKGGDSTRPAARWTSVVETEPGLTSDALLEVASPIRRVKP